MNTSDRRKVINIVKNENTNADKVQWVIQMVRENNGMEYAIQKMNDYKKEAENILFEFPDSAARNSIYELIQFTINRKN
jgi:octaprenyl-diphosphate synthase